MCLVDCTVYTSDTETHSYSLSSSRENSALAHFAAAIASHYNLDFFIPPSTHYCSVE